MINSSLIVTLGCLVLLFSTLSAQNLNSLPDNSWVRISASPGDPDGREVPPGRASTWIYDPISGKMLRYGGYTPTFSNALYSFDLDSLKWTVLFPHDETYPTTRPGAGSSWSLMVDPSDQSILFCGGFGSTFYGTGDHGLWRYSSLTNTFTKISGRVPYPGLNKLIMAYDFKNRTIVSTLPMGAAEGSQGKTYVFPLDSNKWISKNTPSGQNPQESYRDGFPMVYDTAMHKILCFKSGATLMDVWAFDVTISTWTLLTTTNAPPKRQWAVAAYDPLNKVTFMTGITDDKASTGVKTDVWVFNSATLA
ncbi:MAG: hypothetical protein JNL74_14630, partial [Fibrobacteres bacterium]|nr:hypothetical protein [Fibrobacterota bacterium]